MPKIPLTSLSLAPQGQGGVNPPDTGLISDAVGKAIQSAGMDRARGAMAVAEGEMAKGKAIADVGKSIAGVAGAFAALGEREKKLDSLETRLAFDQDLQRHYLTRDEFELANSNNPIDKNGKNIFTDYAIRGIADLRKKYGEMELDPNTAGYIAGQLSEHTIKSPAEARINSIRQRGVNFNNQFKTALEGNNFDSANQINQAAKDNGLINDVQFEANSSAIGESKKKFVREGGDQRVSALLLDNNITEADREFAILQEEGGYTDDEKKYNQAVYDNKKANTVVYNTTLNNALEQPSAEYQRILDEEKRRTQPGWKEDPKDPTGLGRLDNVQIADLKEKVGTVVSTKANEQFSKVIGTLQDAPAGETREQFNERLKTEVPELYNYDNGSIAAFLFDYSKSGKTAQGGITGYFLDKINDIDFEDQSAGAIQERGMILNAIDQFTDGGVKDELKKQWSEREKLHTDPASLPQVKTMESMADAMVDALPIPEIPAPEVEVEASKPLAWYNPKRLFGYTETEAKVGRPGKMVKKTYVDENGKEIEDEVFVPDTDKSQEEIIKQERKDLSNAIKAQLRENAANGKYTKEDGTFNTDMFRNDFNGIMSDLNPPTVPEQTRGITTPGDESDSITPQERAVKDTGADVPLPTPAPMEYELPPVEQLEEVFNPEQPSMIEELPPGSIPSGSMDYRTASSAKGKAKAPTAAAPEGGYKFVVDTRTRDELESTSSTVGSRIVSLDYNSATGGANYAMIVIPNDATAEEREAAQLYVDSLTEWFRSNGVEVSNPVVKTTGENGRGVGGFFHTEPAFVQNAAAMALLKDKADEHAAILASTLGILPGTKFIAPHKSNDPGAGAPGILGERDFARAYTLPSLEKILSGEISPAGETNKSGIKVQATAYAPRRGASNVSGAGGEGGYESSRPGPDGQAIVRTLDDVLTGNSDYITIAGNPDLYGREYIIPEITYTDKQGVRHNLINVRAVVHDTGSAFKNKPEGRFDIPVARDASKETMAANHASWKNIQFIPAET